MTHIWLRHEGRDNEARSALTPRGAKKLIERGFHVTVEDSPSRCFATQDYAGVGCEIAPLSSWPDAPMDAIILGLKELPDDGTALRHRHILFGHAYKGQPEGALLLARFQQGGGTLFDLEYLVDEAGKRVAAFGYWAGYAGAAVSLKCWAAQQRGSQCGPVTAYESSTHLIADLNSDLHSTGTSRPSALVIGALGRVGTGAIDLCTVMGVPTTKWDMAETAHGGPFPEIAAHNLFLNCILARPGTPVFVPPAMLHQSRRLSVIGDIACDPGSDFNPVPIYDRVTSWDVPALRVQDTPLLDVMAIDNLPSMLPVESSEDFAEQLLPHLIGLDDVSGGVWGRAEATYQANIR